MYGPWENAGHEWCASSTSGRILLSEFLKCMAHKQGQGGQTEESEQNMQDRPKERKKEGKEPEHSGGIHMCHMIPRTPSRALGGDVTSPSARITNEKMLELTALL
jgi:hypothetical protein